MREVKTDVASLAIDPAETLKDCLKNWIGAGSPSAHVVVYTLHVAV